MKSLKCFRPLAPKLKTFQRSEARGKAVKDVQVMERQIHALRLGILQLTPGQPSRSVLFFISIFILKFRQNHHIHFRFARIFFMLM